MTGAILGTATPAHSWVHPIGKRLRYFQPDGERRETDWIRGCIVDTVLEKHPEGDIASLDTYNGLVDGLGSHCAANEGYITIITWDGNRLNPGPTAVTSRFVGPILVPAQKSNYLVSSAISVGRVGEAILGASICATNTNALTTCWDVTVF